MGPLRFLQSMLKRQLVLPLFGIFKNCFVCMGVLPACAYAYHMCAWHGRRSERVLDSLKFEKQLVVSHLCGCWEQNLGTLEKLPELLLNTEPSLQLFIVVLFRLPCCWDTMGAASLSYVEDSVSLCKCLSLLALTTFLPLSSITVPEP